MFADRWVIIVFEANVEGILRGTMMRNKKLCLQVM